MDTIIREIIERLRAGGEVDDRVLVKLVHAAAKRAGTDKRAFAKRRLLPYYQHVKRDEPEVWEGWGVTPDIERRLLRALRMKPRRSASGVATITVITKPWPCSGSCVFCPSDLRMPKSYLADEPACARAEQCRFDPYLQVSARLTALTQMGHATDKIELIVLGGTWSDYPAGYQRWFVCELFRALNDDAVAGVGANPQLRGFCGEGGAEAPDDAVPAGVAERRGRYGALGAGAPEGLARLQAEVDAGALSYNEAVRRLYGEGTARAGLDSGESAGWDELEREQRRNETARHRVVGLVIETRPDAVTPARLVGIRRLGATKVQMGIQSTDQRVLDANGRNTTVAEIERALSLTRLLGFKTHTHFMVNLVGATPETDRADYARFATAPGFQPDEVKLYPCALIAGTGLDRLYERGLWRPYTEGELVGVLADDVARTPAWTRVSRMIRDFSSGDIKAGNKKPNLRQMVEGRLRDGGVPVREIRFREIGTDLVDTSALELETVPYETLSTSERFLQWVTPEGRIAGFLRLSLPHPEAVRELARELEREGGECPVGEGEAMIREVHVYGMATRVGDAGPAAQHHGLGRRLVERACEIARAAGYGRINVISAVGTREYYRRLGFADHGLYQRRDLDG